MLSLYVLPCDNPDLHNPDRTVDSFGDVVNRAVILEHRRVSEIKEQLNDYYCFMYSSEVIDEELRESLPVFLKEDFDYLVLYSRRLVGSNHSFSISPRIFKAYIRLCNDIMLPVGQEKMTFVKILNGWICNASDNG